MTGRLLSELIDQVDPAWGLVQSWLSQAGRRVTILPPDRGRAERTLVWLQITTRSPLGAVALESGGVLVDHGWTRLFGSGHPAMAGGLLEWNDPRTGWNAQPMPGGLLVGDDVAGGFFALNGGFAAGKPGNVFYFAPDSLRWENLGFSYSGLLQWCGRGDLQNFYSNVRWPGWEDTLRTVQGDRGFSFYPPLWAAASPPFRRDRREVPMVELWGLSTEAAERLRNAADGTSVRPDVDTSA